MSKFYMTYVQVEVRTSLCASWIDDQIKRRLAAEIQTYGKYGHVQVWSSYSINVDWFYHYFMFQT